MIVPTFGASAHAHCLTCEKVTRFRWSGCESLHPRIDVWTCTVDSHVRIQMADVTDAEALLRAILRSSGSSFPTQEEYEDAVSHLRVELWTLYRQYDPTRGVRFTSYATGILRLRVNNIWQIAMGRTTPKAHFGALSLDAVDDQGEAEVPESELARALAAVNGDPQLDCSPDLGWAIAQGGRGTTQPLPPDDRALASAEGRHGSLDWIADAAVA